MNNDQTKNTGISGDGEPLGALLSQHKAGYARKLYKAQADAHRAAELQKDIRTKTQFLYGADKIKPVNFDDIDDVKNRTQNYLNACAEVGAFPSMMGLAAFAFGVSRQHLYWRLKQHPDSESSRFIDRTRDLIADILSSAALNRNADNVTTIFILKNGLGFSDRLEIEPVTNHEPEREYNKAELLKRYLTDED